MLSLNTTIINELKQSVASQERRVAKVHTEFDGLRNSVRLLHTEIDKVRSDSLSPVISRLSLCEQRVDQLKPSKSAPDSLSPVISRLSLCEQRLDQLKPSQSAPTTLSPPAPKPSKPLTEVNLPLRDGWFQKADPLEGIVSYLTRKHGGNVHDKGIVIITSSSVYSDDPKHSVRNVGDIRSDSAFRSSHGADQWVRWDFRDMRIRMANYTIKAGTLKSWVVEGSMDGVNWVEVDRQTETINQSQSWVTSFSVTKSVECRFIRLRQLGLNRIGNDHLALSTMEFFGTLFE
jgi:hypothetical protein